MRLTTSIGVNGSFLQSVNTMNYQKKQQSRVQFSNTELHSDSKTLRYELDMLISLPREYETASQQGRVNAANAAIESFAIHQRANNVLPVRTSWGAGDQQRSRRFRPFARQTSSRSIFIRADFVPGGDSLLIRETPGGQTRRAWALTGATEPARQRGGIDVGTAHDRGGFVPRVRAIPAHCSSGNFDPAELRRMKLLLNRQTTVASPATDSTVRNLQPLSNVTGLVAQSAARTSSETERYRSPWLQSVRAATQPPPSNDDPSIEF